WTSALTARAFCSHGFLRISSHYSQMVTAARVTIAKYLTLCCHLLAWSRILSGFWRLTQGELHTAATITAHSCSSKIRWITEGMSGSSPIVAVIEVEEA